MIPAVLVLLTVLKVSLAVESGTLNCAATSLTLDIAWVAGDADKTFMYVKGLSATTNCFNSFTTANAGTITINYPNCGTTQPTTGTEAVTLTIVATQLASGALSAGDTQYDVTCNYENAVVQVTSSGAVPISLSGDAQTIAASPPQLTITTHTAADDAQFTTAIALGTKFYVKACFSDPANTHYKGFSKVVTLTYATSGTPENIITDGCLTGLDGSTKTATGCPIGTYDAVTELICVESCDITAIKFPGTTNLQIALDVQLCPVASDARCQQRTDCPITRRRRSIADDPYVIHANVTVPFVQEKEQPQEPDCVGYTSNTVFYVVVIVLASLLVITIGVAAFFGARARSVVVVGKRGKDNPVYA